MPKRSSPGAEPVLVVEEAVPPLPPRELEEESALVPPLWPPELEDEATVVPPLDRELELAESPPPALEEENEERLLLPPVRDEAVD